MKFAVDGCRKMVVALAALLCLNQEAAVAQPPSAQLSGSWQAPQRKALLYMQEDTLRLHLTMNDSMIVGTSVLEYHGRRGGSYELHKLKGRLRADGLIVLEETLMSTDFNPDDITSGRYELRLRRTDTSQILSGVWHDKQRFFLTRSKVFFEKKLPRKDSAAVAKRWAHPGLRSTLLQGQLTVPKALSRQPLQLQLFDNGEVDGDTVSLYYNGCLLFDRVGLGRTPLVWALVLDESATTHELVFAAHNLGSLPPNTGLLVVTLADGRRHELSFTANEQQNGKVRLLVGY